MVFQLFVLLDVRVERHGIYSRRLWHLICMMFTPSWTESGFWYFLREASCTSVCSPARS